jgi:hypothetical protein
MEKVTASGVSAGTSVGTVTSVVDTLDEAQTQVFLAGFQRVEAEVRAVAEKDLSLLFALK